jgi:hypothetical protein
LSIKEMTHMLPDVLVLEIQRRLAGGESQRSVARQLCVSRGTVGAVASGRRTLGQGRGNPDEGFSPPNGPVARCPECGVKVTMPCLACQIRQLPRDRRQVAGRSWEMANPMRDASQKHQSQEPWRERTTVSTERAFVLAASRGCVTVRQSSGVQNRTPWPRRPE